MNRSLDSPATKAQPVSPLPQSSDKADPNAITEAMDAVEKAIHEIGQHIQDEPATKAQPVSPLLQTSDTAGTNLATETIDGLEAAIRKIGQHIQNELIKLTSTLGSYLSSYVRSAWVLVATVAYLMFMAWLYLIMPYSAWGAVGEYLLRHVSFMRPVSAAVGLLLIVTPPSVLIAIAYLSWQKRKSRSESHVVNSAEKAERVFALLAGKVEVRSSIFRVVPNLAAGHWYWLTYVVGSAALITIATEIGWFLGYQPFTSLHDTWFAFINVWALDGVVDLVKFVAYQATGAWV